MNNKIKKLTEEVCWIEINKNDILLIINNEIDHSLKEIFEWLEKNEKELKVESHHQVEVKAGVWFQSEMN